MDFNALASECAPWVAPQTLAAIVRTESDFKPLTIGVNGGYRLARQPSTLEEAVVTAKWLLSNGYNIDMGLGQVNSANLAKTGLSVETVFDPCKNLAAAAKILQSNYSAANPQKKGEQRALHEALSAYNTGSPSRGFSNGYVQKVISNAPGVVAPIPLALSARPSGMRRVAVDTKNEADKKSKEGSALLSMDGGARDVHQEASLPSEQAVMIYRE